MFLIGRSRIFSSSNCQEFGGNTERHGSIQRVTITRSPRAARYLGGITTRPFSSRAYSASPLSIQLCTHPYPHDSLWTSTFLHNFPLSLQALPGFVKKIRPLAGPRLAHK